MKTKICFLLCAWATLFACSSSNDVGTQILNVDENSRNNYFKLFNNITINLSLSYLTPVDIYNSSEPKVTLKRRKLTTITDKDKTSEVYQADFEKCEFSNPHTKCPLYILEFDIPTSQNRINLCLVEILDGDHYTVTESSAKSWDQIISIQGHILPPSVSNSNIIIDDMVLLINSLSVFEVKNPKTGESFVATNVNRRNEFDVNKIGCFQPDSPDYIKNIKQNLVLNDDYNDLSFKLKTPCLNISFNDNANKEVPIPFEVRLLPGIQCGNQCLYIKETTFDIGEQILHILLDESIKETLWAEIRNRNDEVLQNFTTVNFYFGYHPIIVKMKYEDEEPVYLCVKSMMQKKYSCRLIQKIQTMTTVSIDQSPVSIGNFPNLTTHFNKTSPGLTKIPRSTFFFTDPNTIITIAIGVIIIAVGAISTIIYLRKKRKPHQKSDEEKKIMPETPSVNSFTHENGRNETVEPLLPT